MTADLPSIALGMSANYGLGFERHAEVSFKSAVHGRSKHDQNDHFPGVTSNQSKRNSDGQMLQVKFAPNVVIPEIERMKTALPGFDPVLNVDHKHYEQWARVPGRRMTSSTLLRGIQQLKARMKRESLEQERYELGLQNKDFHIHQLNKNTLLTRDRLSDDNTMCIRREKSNVSTDSTGLKTQIQPRSPLKTSAHVIDAGVFKHANHESGDDNEEGKERETKSGRFLERENSKARLSVSKSRERCALPVSVYQPISIGEHVFLINEPMKYSEFLKMKKTEYRVKKDPKSATMIFMPDKSGKIVNLPDPQWQNEPERKDNKTDSSQRTKTIAGGFPPSRPHKRTPVMVSSAEVFDFSQIAEIKHLMEDKYFERSKTELSFPSKGGKYSKWVPNVQRFKDVIK